MKIYSSILLLCMTYLSAIDCSYKSIMNGLKDHKIIECKQPNVIALTFDDGPRWDFENILDILRLNNIKATFFVLGKLLNEEKSLVQLAFKEGHNIGSHTWSHPNLTKLNEKKSVWNELSSTAELIERNVGKWPKYFRPPYGDANNQIVHIAKQLGQETIMWNIDTKDWDDAGGAFNKIKSGLRPGSGMRPASAIILMHDWTGMSYQLQDIIDLGHEWGYKFVNMDECLSEIKY